MIGLLVLCLVGWTLADDSEITKFMKEIEIIPDILTEAPQEFVKIEFENGVIGDRGGELTPTQTKDAPQLDWSAESDTYYTIIMGNVDPPSRSKPKWREWVHWLVVNVPGKDVDRGEILATYLGPAPPKSSGLLRYVFLVYKQPGKLAFEETPLTNTSVEGHENFSSTKFSEKYGMGPPVAGNVIQCQWAEYVPNIHLTGVGLK